MAASGGLVHRLPYVYTAILLAEVVFLLQRYLADAPASSSPFSVGLGWVGIGSMVLLLVYSVARRSRGLRRLARLSYWLHFHIFLACQGFVGVLFHSWNLMDRPAFNLLNPAILSGAATVVIFCSGLFGRYLYSILPRTLGGVQLQAREVEEELNKGLEDLPEPARQLLAQQDEAPSSPFAVLAADLGARGALRDLKTLGMPKETVALVAHRMRLGRRRAALKVVEPIFRAWIILHRPLAAVLYIIAGVHIAFAYMFSSAMTG